MEEFAQSICRRRLMRRSIDYRYNASLLAWAVVSLLAIISPAMAIDVGTSTSFRQQTFDAWGTSLAWFGNALGNWSDSRAYEEVFTVLFDGPNHLGLNYARYNIGGGQNPLLTGNLRPGAAVPGWAPLAPISVTNVSTWNWNWNADPGQRKTLDAAIARGVNRVDAVSYSAPYWMTASYDTAGSVSGGDNLLTSLYDEYAHYQTEVIKHFRDERGIQFGTFAPMNEPDATWWKAGGAQEGMHVSPGFNQRALIEAVGQALTAKGLVTGVSASDAFSANASISALNQYNATTLSYVKQINTHVYGGDGGNSIASMQAIRSIAKSRNIPLYQSEYGNNSTSGLSGGIELANRITADLNVMGVNGWTFWQAVEPLSLSGAGWGLLWADYNASGNEYVVRQQYHVMRQFTSYIRPGADILRVDDAKTVAAYDSGSDSTVLVFTNDDSAADVNEYRLLDKTPAYSRVIRTDGSGNFVSLGPANISGNQVTLSSPGTAVTTAVIYHRTNLIQNAGFAGGSASWQSSGNVAPAANFDNTHDGSGSVLLQNNGVAPAGAIWQEGLGDARLDLTGKAFEFSADLILQNTSQLDSNVRIALEFYGADGQTLTHGSTNDFAEELKPLTQDSKFRVFRTSVAEAPAGTRFVRPVVRFDDISPGSSGLVYLDNAYLQETRYAPRARTWNANGNGSWGEDENWQNDALTENNRVVYFGPAAAARRTIAIDESVTTAGITFDSEWGYKITGDATLTVGDGQAIARVDVRSGTNVIGAPTVLSDATEVRVVGDSRLEFDETLNLNGQRLEKTGSGRLQLTGGLAMNGGTLAIEATLSPGVVVSGNSMLDGVLEVSLATGQRVAWGNLYTLVNLTSANQSFSQITLPELDKKWLEWEVRQSGTHLTAEVVNRADFNRDGRMDSIDLAQLRSSFGSDAGADIDGDGATDGSDFLLWQRAFGEAFETNSLSLLVDPVTGDARLTNLSTYDFSIDAYTISSTTSALLPSWTSFQDQGLSGWLETLPSSERVSELNPGGELLLSPGVFVDLPGLFDAASGSHDLSFQFRDVILGTISGAVIYAPLLPHVPSTIQTPEPRAIRLLLVSAAIIRRSRRGRSR